MDTATARGALCVALDGSDRRWIVETARALAGEVGWLKLGLEAFTAHGTALVRQIVELECPVFLDLKLHDIPNTVRRATANCAAAGVNMLTVHATGGPEMLTAAVSGALEGSRGSPPKIVAVTLLTSLDSGVLSELGIESRPEDTVIRLARLARRRGLDGVVSSALEAGRIRDECGPDFVIVTPGIRPVGTDTNDQRRSVTPSQAIRHGADILVVGRPITRAASPLDAARSIVAEMASAMF
jgi:orotidine-5'-phosphate decarboxylase